MLNYYEKLIGEKIGSLVLYLLCCLLAFNWYSIRKD